MGIGLMAKIQDIDIPHLEFAEAAAPSTPASGIVRIYAKSDGLLYSKDDAGSESPVSGAGSATPPDGYSSVITSAVTMTNATTWYDSGASLSLPAGTYMLFGECVIRVTASGATFLMVRIVDSSAATSYAGAAMNVLSNATQEITIPIMGRVTLGSTTTVKMQAQDFIRAGSVIVDTPAGSAFATDLFTKILAIKVTSA
jgi:hypothetical protein